MKKGLLWLARALASRRTFALSVMALLLAIRVLDPHAWKSCGCAASTSIKTSSRAPRAVNPVVIVDIDENSMSALGQWPWPRTMLADLLTRLHEMEAVAVGFDVVFPEPDRASPGEAVKHFRNLDKGTRELLAHLPSNDNIFAQVIGEGKVVLGQSGTHTINVNPPGQRPETGIATMGADPSPFLIVFPFLLRNLPELEQAAAGRGLFSIRPERDGIVRRMPIVMKAEGKIVPSLTLDMLRVVTESGAILIRSDEAGVRTVAVPGMELPTDQNGRIWVHFGPHDPARYVSAKDVLEGNVTPERFSGKLVLIGTSAIGLSDIKTTPVSAAIPGVEVHAQLLEVGIDRLAAIRAKLCRRSRDAQRGRDRQHARACSPVRRRSNAACDRRCFGRHLDRRVVDRVQPLSDALRCDLPADRLLVVSVSLVLIGYFREQLDRRRIRAAFGQYLSPTLVDRLARSPKQLVLGGEERVMTILFSDVRGFTTISETFKHDPQGLTTLMNRFLTAVTNAIVACNGTIDKYIGDAVMAFWNAPLDDPDHETQCLPCSARHARSRRGAEPRATTRGFRQRSCIRSDQHRDRNQYRTLHRR